MPGADKLFDIARALDCSPEWLATGRGPEQGADAVKTDDNWLLLPCYDIHALRADGKPEPGATIPLRREWLSRTAAASDRLWLTYMPPSLLEDAPQEGEQILCRDAAAPDGEGLYLWLLDGMPLVRQLRLDPFAPAGFGAGGRGWQAADDTGPRLVARILGAIKLWGA